MCVVVIGHPDYYAKQDNYAEGLRMRPLHVLGTSNILLQTMCTHNELNRRKYSPARQNPENGGEGSSVGRGYLQYEVGNLGMFTCFHKHVTRYLTNFY